MGRYSTPEEVKKEHLDKLGPDFGPTYHALWNECYRLHLKWQQYKELYGTNPERIDLLNNAAKLFFFVVEESLWQDILLHLSALTDPPELRKRNKKNLTICQLPTLVAKGDFQKVVRRAVNTARKKSEFAREWRNRKYVHRDLALAIQIGAEPLPAASRLKVQEAIDAVSEVIKEINIHYFNSDIGFDLIHEPEGGLDLLYLLRDGLDMRVERRERLRRGKAHPTDLKPLKPI